MSIQKCALCANDTSSVLIADQDKFFCCHGCQSVYNILSVKNLLRNYQETTIFQHAVRYGVISNPALLEQIRQKQTLDGEIEKIYFEIEDMWCPSCAEVIKLVLLQESGIKSCVVDYSTDLAAVEFSPKHLSKEHIFQQIKSLGYKPEELRGQEQRKINRALALRLCVAAFCSMNIMMFSYPLYATYFDYDEANYASMFAWLSLVFALPVVMYSGWPICRRFLTSLRVGIYGMETLVCIGVVTSFLLSFYELFRGGTRVYFDSMTVIIGFVLLGKAIESKAKFSARESLFRLNRSIPKRGRKRFPDQTTRFAPIKEIAVGDLLIAFSGEKIILDGVIVEGEGACDESVMTGESLPVSKTVDSSVLSGTILQSGWIMYRVKTSSEQSTLQKIVDLVGKDINLKVNYGNIVDNIVHWFVPVVLAISLASISFSLWQGNSLETTLIRGISVLLISCPCALGIAAPLADSQLLHRLAELGAIVRNRGCLRLLGKETVFVFDKTGTITEGKFSVVDGLCDDPILKALASQSTHPMSQAIAGEGGNIVFSKIQEFSGKGIQGDTYRLGSAEFVGVKEKEDGITSRVYFTKNGELITVIKLADKIRNDAKQTLIELKPARSWLVSGDSAAPVRAIALECGFQEWRAKCSPLMKREEIESLRSRGEVVCMVGDGINDALALTNAHVAISMLNATDISIQVSDILLTTDKLSVIPKIRALAQRGRRIMHQNLFWTFFYNVVGIGLAFFGLLSPLFAAFAMVASSLMVLLNAKRL